MAFHYLKNIDTGDTRTIRTETLSRYQDDPSWRIFDTEAERDAFTPPPFPPYAVYMQQLWEAGMQTVPENFVTRLTSHDVQSYRTSGSYILCQTMKEAKGWLTPCYQVDGAKISTRTKAFREYSKTRYPGRAFYDTREEAETARGPVVWIADRFGCEYSAPFEVKQSDIEDGTYGYPSHLYIHADTKEAALAAWPQSYTYQSGSGQYRRGTKKPHVTPYRVTRHMILAAREDREAQTYYVIPEPGNPGYGARQAYLANEYARLWKQFYLSRYERWINSNPANRDRAASPEFMKGFQAYIANAFVHRVNDLCGAQTIGALCPVCEGIPLFAGAGNDVGAIDGDGEPLLICDHCIGTHCGCSECHDLFERSTMRANDEGAMFCADHPPRLRDPANGQLMAYSTNVLHRKTSFLLATGERKADLWLGWELEVYPTDRTTVPDAVKKVREIFGEYVICKSDSTISSGFEMVSIPATLQWHREHSIPFLRAMSGHIEGWKHNNAGLHVHVGRKELTRLQEGRMSAFIDHDANRAFVTKIAGRDPTEYCGRVLKKLSVGRTHANRGDMGAGRYHALNFNTKDQATAEYRLFRSNVSPLGFLKALEFVHCLTLWARDCGNLVCAPSQIGIRTMPRDYVAPDNPYSKGTGSWRSFNATAWSNTQAQSESGVQAFIAYVVKHRGEYPKLHQWLGENGYIQGARFKPVSLGA